MTLIKACPLCGDDFRQIKAPPIAIGGEQFTGLELGLAACRGCGVRFINPRPDDQTLSNFYNAEGYDCHNPLFGSDGKARLRIIQRFVRSGTLCDFGAGAGRLLELAQSEGWRVCGVEAGRLARQRLNAAGLNVVEDLRSLRDRPDVFSMVHVLEHLTSPTEVLSEVRERLNPKGIFYVEVPNAASLRAQLATSPLKSLWTNAPEKFLAYPIHLLYFHARSLRLLLQNAGFEILEMGTLGMGVEELFAQRSKEPSSQPTATSVSSSRHQTPRFRTAKQAIKKGFSRMRLGENLYAVSSVS